VEQIVILGAGNDSRAYRMPGMQKVRVFEIDLPRTQARKQRLVGEIYGQVPPNVTFIPMDFEKDKLDVRLREAGFDPSRKTLFSWEGVSFYLTKDAVVQVLRLVAELSKAGGALVFDYSLRSYTEARDLDTYGGRKLYKWLADRGLKYVFGAEPREMAALVDAQGFDVISDVGPIELERYLQTPGRTAWRVWGNFRIVHARLRPSLPSSKSIHTEGGAR
jgi:methyltransferase (TIGR00027 family)